MNEDSVGRYARDGNNKLKEKRVATMRDGRNTDKNR